jgi:predicted DNA-binding transcriptional regulator AlpA
VVRVLAQNSEEHMTVELWDCRTVCRFYGGSKPIHLSSLYRGINAGRFPKPIKVGLGAVRWDAAEVRASIEAMRAERDAAA